MNKLVLVLAIALLGGCAMKDTTIRASLTTRVSGDYDRYVGSTNYHGGHMGRLELDVPLYRRGSLTFGAVVSHESLLDTRLDRGDNRAGLAIGFAPFGGVR